MEEFIVTNNTSFANVAIDTVNDIVQDVTNHVDDIYICKTNIKKTGKRRNPEFAHDTDVGLDMYPCSLSLESYSGNSYKIELTEDESFTERQIIEAEDLEKLQFPFWKRIINFLMGKEHRLGWKRLKFDTGIAIDPEITCFYYGAPNSRVVKTDVILQNSVGIIDPTYRGTIRFFYRNMENGFIRDSVKSLCNCCGQIFPALRIKPKLNFVDKLSTTERGEGGFGSSVK